MARSKTLLLEISDDCRDVHVQTEQDNSDITHSRYSLFHWDRSPQDVIDWMEAALKSDPVSALGPMGPIKRGGQDSDVRTHSETSRTPIPTPARMNPVYLEEIC